jgi:dipeptidyl aminopeptidase/acylaminoacyl peptidase
MTAFRLCLVLLAGLLSTASSNALAQSPRPMGLVDLLNIPRLGDPQLSPDGRHVLYTRAESDWKSSRRVTHVWKAPTGGGDAVQLTSAPGSETSPRWSPDGRTIAFLTKRGDAEFDQIYLLPVDGGEARPLTSHATAVSRIAWTADGTALLFTAAEVKSAQEKARDRMRDDAYEFEENYKQTHLWKVGVASKVETQITKGDFSVTSYELSADGRKVVYHAAPSPLLGDGDRGEVWIANSDGTGAVRLTSNAVAERGARISPDGSQVLFMTSSNAQFDPYYNARLFVVPASGGAARALVGEKEPYAVDSALWSKDGAAIYMLVNLGVHEELFVVPAKGGGTPTQLTGGRHDISELSGVAGRLAFILSDSTSADIWTMSVGDAADRKTSPGTVSPSRVTHVFGSLAKEFKLGRQEAISWKGADGVTVEGILTYPVDYRSGEKYPFVVMTHGGPQDADKYSLGRSNYELQVFAGKGYAVLQPNYRGSTGYGDVFLRDMIGHYFQNAHLDVMAGADEVIRRGIADPDRMVKMGWSGGGHMTNKIITFTDRFKAAASGAGVAQWVSMYAQSDVRMNRTPWFGGTPWQKNAPIDVYWDNSPLKDVANVKTPTIFFVGERDPRVPMPQSVEMYRALKSNDVPTHLYVAPREPHVWEELHHNLLKMNAELAWFEKYATRRPYAWEMAPGDNAKDSLITTAQQQR